MHDFKGVYPILATPFRNDESFDEDSLRRMLAFMQRIGVQGVTVLGVLGEANRMSDREREAIVRTTVGAVGGTMTVIVGISHPGTRATVELGRMAAELGADALMVTPSAEPAPNDARVAEYFGRVCEGVSLPVVLQDHPASTGVHMGVPLIAKIVADNARIACIKAEAVPSAPKIAAMKAALSRELPMLTGLGALYGQFDLEQGSSGYNTGFAFPEVLQAHVAAWQHGDKALARRIWNHFLPLIVFEQQPGVAVRKELLRRRGLLGTGTVRHPGGALAPVSAAQLTELLEAVMPGVDITQPLDVASVIG
ncbi:dihydrodipicolinate synthase family protein [Burkholderiaceae bacterium FT117]|uniref:dihydrodipicolinate synthase family protein n=1 Tax=Zeimonas sediminis TaxID=2944268 RepID=UPI0023432382|nr:dihydrodipicolinate synthase family protein [Zeimonas sediminis]MCM5570123.1 dihydrodipicolinate synthase family protein [Zeimonas sediminis]